MYVAMGYNSVLSSVKVATTKNIKNVLSSAPTLATSFHLNDAPIGILALHSFEHTKRETTFAEKTHCVRSLASLYSHSSSFADLFTRPHDISCGSKHAARPLQPVEIMFVVHHRCGLLGYTFHFKACKCRFDVRRE